MYGFVQSFKYTECGGCGEAWSKEVWMIGCQPVEMLRCQR